jgi:hypothetical protein
MGSKMTKSLLLIFVSTLTTCLDPIDFITTTPENSLVVEGQFTTGELGNYVYLSKVSEFGKLYRLPVTGATVRVINDAGDAFPFAETSPGIYDLVNPVETKGITGQQYHLEVVLADGTAYSTAPEIMPTPVTIDTMFLNISNLSNGRIDVSVNATFPDNPTWLKYKVVENYSFDESAWSIFVPSKTCYFQLAALTPFYLATNDNNTATGLDHFLVGTRTFLTGREFSRGRHYFSVYQYAETQNAYAYFDKLNKLLNLNGSVFDAPPAAIEGNLYLVSYPEEKTLGYFELAAVDTMRRYTYPALIRQYYTLPDHCDLEQSYYYSFLPKECCDCLLLPGASLIKPDWFE